MKLFIRYIGVSLIAVGLAVLMFLLFIRITSPQRILSPAPDEFPVEGVQLMPGR